VVEAQRKKSCVNVRLRYETKDKTDCRRALKNRGDQLSELCQQKSRRIAGKAEWRRGTKSEVKVWERRGYDLERAIAGEIGESHCGGA